jgi:hypothetical protein
VAALMILTVTASVASADEGLTPSCVPYDPGLPSVSDLSPLSGPFAE